jgi:hypothetical protein
VSSSLTITTAAIEVRRCLSSTPPDRHEAFRWVVQFMADFVQTDDEARAGLVAEEPPGTGDARWDAMLAAATEHLCFHHGLAVPVWTLAAERFLDQWWFVAPYLSLHASAFVATPAAFANRGVFVHADSLKSL